MYPVLSEMPGFCLAHIREKDGKTIITPARVDVVACTALKTASIL